MNEIAARYERATFDPEIILKVRCSDSRHYFEIDKGVRVAIFCDCKIKVESFPAANDGTKVLSYGKSKKIRKFK